MTETIAILTHPILVEFSLTQDKEGRLELRAKRKDDKTNKDPFHILDITPQGQLILIGYIPNELGLQTDEYGQLIPVKEIK